MTIRSRINEISGAWLKRLSDHKDLNSTERFFFMISARRKGAIAAMVRTPPSIFPHKSPSMPVIRGTMKCRNKAVTATESTE